MCDSGRFFVGLLGVAVATAAMTMASTARAQESVKVGTTAKAKAKAEPEREPVIVLFDNDKVRVQEITFKPGAQGPNVARPFRVIRVLAGGTMQRIYPDGKTENVVYKTGEVKVYEADKPFVPVNVGKSDIVLYVVALKGAER